MFNFYQIAKNTFRESLREPIFFILLVSALVLIGLFPSMSLFVFREQIKLVVDSAMATTLVFGLVAAVLCASHTVAREMRNGTVLLLMSKPVSRCAFVLAKISGVGIALILFVLICNCATLVSLKIAKDQFQLDFTLMYIYFGLILLAAAFGGLRNYLAGASFASNAIFALLLFIPVMTVAAVIMIPSHEDEIPLLRVLPALILLFFSVGTMGVITVTLATRLDMIPNMLISGVIFFLGLLSGYLFDRDFGSPFINLLAGIAYSILPNWQFFWMADPLAANQSIPMNYVLWATVYVVLYIGLASLWAVTMFENREMARDTRQ